MDGRATHMVAATAALSAFALLLAGPAGAYLPEGDGVHAVGAQSQARQQAQSVEPGTIPYLSHGMGVDESQFAGRASQVDAQHQALVLNREAKSAALELDPAIRTAIDARSDEQATAPLPHGIQVVLSPPSAPEALGLNGDSALTRVAAPEPEGLTGDSAATRYPDARSTTTVSAGDGVDWTSFGVGAGMAAFLAAGCAGILLTTRRRHTVGMS